ncbi:MAG TPA: tetratricopeptide repeat protein [Vicinamibacterales bacterium]|jgi:predicted membrane-bound spermidine synthase
MWVYLLFLCSGVSGLIYQVVWVRVFSDVFGNTVYSASIVVAVFMLGVGFGSYLFGGLADRRYQTRSDVSGASDAAALIRWYAWLEGLIAVLGLLVSLVLPRLGAIVARMSSYETGPDGWQLLTQASYLSRAVIALVLLTPITLLMGGTLTVLVRALVGADLRLAGWRIALLYGANTIGAAGGAFLTDFALVPAAGLFATQCVAVGLNMVAAIGAFALSGNISRFSTRHSRPRGSREPQRPTPEASLVSRRFALVSTAVALALSGFAALGMEILWLRHLSVLLGGFRAVFSLLLAVMLLALGVGALAGGWLDRRFGRPLLTLMVVEALFVVTVLGGLFSADAERLAARGASIATTLGALSPWSRSLTEIWFNVRPMLLEVAIPSLVAGLAFPLGNAIVQSVEAVVGRRAGLLYLANTLGAVSGSLVTGYLLLPLVGMQQTATALGAIAALSIVPLVLIALERRPAAGRVLVAGAALPAVLAVLASLFLPRDYLVRRALGPREDGERIVHVSEGITELIAVVERPGRGRGLLTNGHAMSSTALLDQRYMRALAHIPLLSLDQPSRVLVIGFGVGNTAHAATLHSSVRRVDVADLSRQILEHAPYFRDANHDVLRSPKVSVFINDGRQHLEMAAPATYDLITLEPPPIAHAGVGALYSREFYELARSRLAPGGYVSQWLPAYQVPEDSSLAMVRAFIDVFPQSVLLSGTQAELLLVGTTGRRIELDPDRVTRKLESEPAVRDDLARVDLGTLREIAGTFVGAAETMARATLGSPATTDDRPLQEYGVRSGLTAALQGVPSSLFDVTKVAAWCPRCAEPRVARRSAANVDLYLRLLQQAYYTPVPATASSAAFGSRRLLGSAYLGAVVPDTAEVHNLLGLAEMRAGRVDDAISEFEGALARDPGSANARANLGQIRYELGAELLESRKYADAASALRSAVDLLPDSAQAQNDLGVALASMGRVDEARSHFERAVAIEPTFAEARRNLEAARKSVGD